MTFILKYEQVDEDIRGFGTLSQGTLDRLYTEIFKFGEYNELVVYKLNESDSPVTLHILGVVANDIGRFTPAFSIHTRKDAKNGVGALTENGVFVHEMYQDTNILELVRAWIKDNGYKVRYL